MKIFVYGTLKPGYGNNRLLIGAQHEGIDIVAGYKLNSSGIPFAVPNEGTQVRGHIYDIGDTEQPGPRAMLSRLDGLEGHPTGYTRTPVVTVAGVDVNMYVWRHGDRGDNCPVIDGAYEWHR